MLPWTSTGKKVTGDILGKVYNQIQAKKKKQVFSYLCDWLYNEGTDLLRVTHLPGIDWLEQHEMDPALYTETKPKNTHLSVEKLTEAKCTKLNKRNGT